MRIFLILILWTYIKYIALLFLLFNVLVEYESSKILNNKSYPLDDGYTNDCFKPFTFDSIPNKMPIGTVLYYTYWNKVFDSAYNKNLNKKRYLLNFINLKFILERLILWYIGLTKLFIILTLIILKLNKDLTLNDFLFNHFIKPIDDRQLIKINNRWVNNDGKKNFLIALDNLLMNKTASVNQINSIKHNMAIFYNAAMELKFGTTTYSAKFIDKSNTKISHTVFPEIAKGWAHVGMQTDFQKAIAHDHYGRPQIINKYEGIKKPSTLLQTEISTLRQVSHETTVSTEKLCMGAIRNGYNHIFTIYWMPSALT